MSPAELDDLADEFQELIDRTKAAGVSFWRCCSDHFQLEADGGESKGVNW